MILSRDLSVQPRDRAVLSTTLSVGSATETVTVETLQPMPMAMAARPQNMIRGEFVAGAAMGGAAMKAPAAAMGMTNAINGYNIDPNTAAATLDRSSFNGSQQTRRAARSLVLP